jgi:hypothetical protein
MKFKVLTISLLALIATVSCKKDNDKAGIEEPAVVEVNHFKAILDVVVKQDDSLQLFYMDAAIPSFSEENSVWVYVKGSEYPQAVTFNIPEGIIPSNLRFDISKNEAQEPIVLNNFKMEYKAKVYESKDSTMVNYFLPNDQVEYNPTTKTLSFIKVPQTGFDPFLYSTDLLNKQVQKLLK